MKLQTSLANKSAIVDAISLILYGFHHLLVKKPDYPSVLERFHSFRLRILRIGLAAPQ